MTDRYQSFTVIFEQPIRADDAEALLHLVRAERVDRVTGEYFRVDKIVEEVVDFKRPQIGNKPISVSVNKRP